MTEHQATIRPPRRFSRIWFIPLLALGLGIWLLLQQQLRQGPAFTIEFASADDLVAGKTRIKLLSVDVGLVDSLSLRDDLSGVVVHARLDRQYAHLLRQDTRFWVERARIGTSGISGLDTLLSGAFIKVAPGQDNTSRKNFAGLDNPPPTDLNAPGLRLTISSNINSRLRSGDPVLFNGFEVGSVENQSLDPANLSVHYDVFIRAPYHQLVTHNVRFWDVSGLSVRASARGLDMDVGSLNTLLSGGLSFAVPPGMDKGEPARSGEEFKLYSSFEDTLRRDYHQQVRYVVTFDESVSGLAPGAPVLYRGIPVGQVEKILLQELVSKGVYDDKITIPVLISIAPGSLSMEDTPAGAERLKASLGVAIQRGLHASLQTGNLITGNQLVSLDYHPEAQAQSLPPIQQYPQIPAIAGGLNQLQASASQLLNKLNKLPLEHTLGEANQALQRLDSTLASLDLMLQNPQLQQLPEQLQQSLGQLNSTMLSIRQLSDSLDNSARLLPAAAVEDRLPEVRR